MKPQHKRFFSSLKQVEKRLKLDAATPPSPSSPPPPKPSPPPPAPPQTTETPVSESTISSPIFIQNHHTNTLSSSTHNNNSISQPPQEFLSFNDTNTSQSKPHENPDPILAQNDVVDDIDSMVKILRLSDGKGPEMYDFCDEEFYEKIVKVKGVKCKKDVERLDGWIKYFLSKGGIEPFRLAHLLLAKFAFLNVGSECEGVEFPCTVDEFLRNDPPSD